MDLIGGGTDNTWVSTGLFGRVISDPYSTCSYVLLRAMWRRPESLHWRMRKLRAATVKDGKDRMRRRNGPLVSRQSLQCDLRARRASTCNVAEAGKFALEDGEVGSCKRGKG